VLEGIGLQSESSFSIASACYPYVARRLLSDPSERSQKALEGILYGPAGADGGQLDAKRVKQLVTAFRAYTASTSQKAADAPVLSQGALATLKLALQPHGGPMQRVLLRESARFGAASLALSPLAQALSSALAAAAQGLPAGLGGEVLAAGEAIVRPAPGDAERVAAVSEIMDALMETDGQAQQQPPQMEDVQRWAAAAAPLLPELVPGLAAAALRCGAMCLDTAASRLARAQVAR